MPPDVTVVKSALAGIDGAEVAHSGIGVVARVPVASVTSALDALKESPHAFTMLVDFFGTDTGVGVELTYLMRSLSRDEEVYVRATVPYAGELVSAWNIFPALLLPERETAELFGLSLAGHPNPKRLLTVEGIEPLLLKSVAIRTLEEVRER